MKDIISKRRKELGLTQQELANKLFISDKVISKWETGKSVPDTAILVDLAKALDITINDLLGVEKINRIDMFEANQTMIEMKYKNLYIIFMLFEIITSILLIVGRYIIYGTDGITTGYILIVLGAIIELIGVAFLLVSRNSIIDKYSRVLAVDKKYMNILIITTYILVMMVTIFYVYWHQLEKIQMLVVLSILGVLFLISFIILYNWNKNRK